MISNRRVSKGLRLAATVGAQAWTLRRALIPSLSYVIIMCWLFAGSDGTDLRSSEVLVVPDDPVWAPPGAAHWFGTTGDGRDLFRLARVAMANSVAVAAVASAMGVALSLLVVSLFAYSAADQRFKLLYSLGRAGFLVPGFLVLLILSGGSGGSLVVFLLVVPVMIAFQLSPTVASWYDEAESGKDAIAGHLLGLTRQDMIRTRVLPVVVRRLIGVLAGLIPIIVLVEMGLAFVGFDGGRLSCGSIVAFGQMLIIEAPWLSIYTGAFAALIVGALSLLGWLTSAALKSGEIPRLM